MRPLAHSRLRAFVLLLAVLFGSVGLTVFGPTSQAHADDGGYPYAAYNGPGSDPSQYWWTDSSGNGYSSYGYAYRNCTDYVAWKVQSLGVADSWTRGLGNGGDWYDKAGNKSGLDRGTTPKVGAAAVVPSSTPGFGGFGHVAYVEAVNKDSSGAVTTITVSEYNYDLNGHYHTRTGKPSDMHFTEFVYFGDKMTTPPTNGSGSGGSSPNNTVLKVIKKNQSDGTNAVYWAKADSVYESWWRPGGDGVHHSQLVYVSQGDVKDIDMQILGDNEHLLYTATTHNVYETWWYPNQGIHTSSPPIIHTDNSIRKIIKTIAPDGTHQLYVMTDVGVDEYWWHPGGAISGSRIYTLANPVAMKKFFEPDGRQSLYVADQGYAYEVWWRPGVSGITVGQIIHITQNDIVDLDLTVDASTNQHHLFVGEAGSGAWEAKWTPGLAGISYWHLTADNGVRAIQSYWDGTNYDLYVATAGGVYEYWWAPGSGTANGNAIVTGLSDVHDVDRSVTVDGAQAVYTAFGTNIAETWWWGPGQPLSTSVIE